MKEEQKKKIDARLLIAPLVSVGAFLVLIFGAGYAYFTATTQMNTATYQINMPAQTSLVCTKTDCSVTITPDQMVNDANVISTTTPKGTSSCSVACTCSGTDGATCSYSVGLAADPVTGQDPTTYSPTASLGGSKEFTVTVTSPSGCTAQNSSANETQVNTQAGKTISNCTLTVGGTASATVTAVFKWYNINLDQTVHAGKTYRYTLSTTGGTVG